MEQFFLWIISFLDVALAVSPAWWSSVAQLSASHHPESVFLSPSVPFCSQLEGLSRGQARICEMFTDHIPAVGHGARQAIEECQNAFKNRRWNCSATSEVFGPVHMYGTPEAAFTHAIVSAGVTHEVSRSCRMGILRNCGCGNDPRPSHLDRQWLWGGCGDNIQYGYEFAQNFIDIRERERSYPKGSEDYAKSLVNIWNNEVGRKLVRKRAAVKCKCHGVSGSCNLRTCWKNMPSLRDAAVALLDKYDSAIQVKINRRGNLQVVKKHRHKRASRRDLVYLIEPPDYCRHNDTLLIAGTKGRECQKTGGGLDSCRFLCCGRGYNTYQQEKSEKCGCKFRWCCKVECRVCKKVSTVYTCK